MKKIVVVIISVCIFISTSAYGGRGRRENKAQWVDQKRCEQGKYIENITSNPRLYKGKWTLLSEIPNYGAAAAFLFMITGAHVAGAVNDINSGGAPSSSNNSSGGGGSRANRTGRHSSSDTFYVGALSPKAVVTANTNITVATTNDVCSVASVKDIFQAVAGNGTTSRAPQTSTVKNGAATTRKDVLQSNVTTALQANVTQGSTGNTTTNLQSQLSSQPETASDRFSESSRVTSLNNTTKNSDVLIGDISQNDTFSAVTSVEPQQSRATAPGELSSSFSAILNATKSMKTYEEKEAINKMIPMFSSPDDILSMYENIEFVGRGSAHLIFKVTLKQDRGELKKGAVVALRVSLTKKVKWLNSFFPFPHELKIYSHLSSLSKSKQQITDYIPHIYALYRGPCPPMFETEFGGCPEGYDHVFVTEMEYLESSYEREYGELRNKVSARVAVEQAIGEWAIRTKVGYSITDPDGDVERHHMLKYDPNGVIYHMEKKRYYFPPGYSARQIDYDDAEFVGRQATKNFEFSSCYIGPCRWWGNRESPLYKVDSPDIERFLNEIDSKGFFESMHDNLKEFEVPEGWIPDCPVRHFYLEE